MLGKRATIYLDLTLYRALRFKAAESETSVSALVNDAVADALGEDAVDLAIIEECRNEPNIPFEEFVRDMKRRGKL